MRPALLIRPIQCIAIILAITAGSLPVRSAVFNVNTTNDLIDIAPGDGVCDDGLGNCGLRAAIQEANALAGTDSILLGAGNYVLTLGGINEDFSATGDLDIRSDIIVSGINARTVIVDGNANDRVFHIISGSLTASQITVYNGYLSANHGAGICNDLQTLTLVDVTIDDNHAVGDLGGMSSGAFGGGLYNNNGTITCTRVTISNNTSSGGAGQDGVYPGGGAGGGGGAGMGGGLYNTALATATFTNCTFSNNEATGGDGGDGTWHDNTGTVSSNGGNGGNDGGAGGAASGGNGTNGFFGGGGGGGASITGDGGDGGFGGGGGGGGASSWGGNAGNRGTAGTFGGQGGQMCCSGGSGGGGGAGLGGAIMNYGGGITLNNTTIAMNQSNGGTAGRGWWYTSSSPGQGLGGGLMNYNAGVITINNCLIGENSSSTSEPDLHGTFASSTGHNLIEDPATATLTGVTTGNLTLVNPGIDTILRDNGGPTNTHALIPCAPPSPAMNAGTSSGSPVMDQRGRGRLDSVDIGSFEIDSVYLYFDTVTATICAGTAYMFNGQNRTVAGLYYDTLQTSIGCDSFVTLDLSLISLPITNATDSFCPGGSYTFGGNNIVNPGLVRDTFTSIDGCDSIVDLNLIWTQITPIVIGDSLCMGDVYTFGGNAITLAGTYFDTLTGFGSCDSVVQLDLTYYQLPVISAFDTTCFGDSLSFGGNLYNLPGVYRDTFIAMNGCDSIVDLNLYRRIQNEVFITDSICDGESFSFGGSSLTNTGFYSDTLTAQNGCDSIVFLTLNTYTIPLTVYPQTICFGDSFTFGGNPYFVTGIYPDTFTSFVGCDSIVHLDLQILVQIQGFHSDSICEGQSFNLGTSTYTSTGVYTDTLFGSGFLGCDSIVTLNLTAMQPVISNVSTLEGCDSSSIQLGITMASLPLQFLWSDGSDDPYIWTGMTQPTVGVTVTDNLGCLVDSSFSLTEPVITLDELQIDQISCPNETDGSIYVSASGGQGILNYYWTPINQAGNNIQNLDAGFYHLEITDQSGCSYSDTFEIFPLVPMVLSIVPPESYINHGESIDLELIGDQNRIAGISWAPFNSLNRAHGYTVTATPHDNVTYLATITDTNGCIFTTTAEINLLNPVILIPSGFSPNGDGANDFFEISHYPESLVTNIAIKVFNRWGQNIFDHSDNTNFQWNGTYKGINQPTGTYIYSAEIQFSNQPPRTYHGSVTLIR